MKITIATGPLLPVPAVAGGAIPRMWLGLAQEFVTRGHEVSILARAYPGQVAREAIAGVTVQRFGGFGQSRLATVNVLRDFVYSMRAVAFLPSADILVTNSFWLPVVAAALKASAGRVVVCANRYPKGQYRLYRGSASVTAASTVVGREISRQCHALASRVRVIPNPIDTDTFHPSARLAPEVEKTLLFVGRIHPEKGVHALVKAFVGFALARPDWKLQLVGPVLEAQGGGGASYERMLKLLAREAPVEFSGPVFDHRILAEILRGAAMFCYPSFAESGEALPVAPLEAMACGLPILTSDLECFRDYLVDGETGFTFDHRTGDPVESLVDRLGSLASRPDLLAKVRAAGALRAAQFGYSAVADRFLEEFARIVAGEASASQR
jgi:glycosyltransferase involved in cell wall biosynthesis